MLCLPIHRFQRKQLTLFVKSTATLTLVSLLLASCSSIQRRNQTTQKKDSQKIEKEQTSANQGSESQQTSEVDSKENEPVVVVQGPPPKLGLILGAGGMKTYSYISVLRKLEEAKIPVHAVVGFEWGGLMGALYASKGEANNLEWQAMKLKEEDLFEKGFFKDQFAAAPIDRVQGFLSQVLPEGLRAGQTQVAWSCARVQSGRTYWSDEKSSLQESVSQCLSFPPFFNVKQNMHAETVAIKSAVAELKSRGADVIVFVEAIQEGPVFYSPEEKKNYLLEKIIWEQVQKSYKQENAEINEHVSIYLPFGGIRSIGERRNFIRAGQSAGQSLVDKLVSKYRF